MKNYFIMKYEEYREFVKDDAYNWSYAGHKAGSENITFQAIQQKIKLNLL